MYGFKLWLLIAVIMFAVGFLGNLYHEYKSYKDMGKPKNFIWRWQRGLLIGGAFAVVVFLMLWLLD